MDTIITTRLTHHTTKHEGQFRAIYLDGFPPEERAEFSSLIESITTGSRWFFAAMSDDDLIGFATIVPYVASDIHLLEYFAVARESRNTGIGSILLNDVLAAIRNSQSAVGILLEVETDEEGSADEKQLRKRRIGFYQRHGARVVESVPHYRVPCANGMDTMPMKLMWLPLDGTTDTPGNAKLRECIVGIYVKSYGLREDSPLIEQMLCGIQ